MVSIRGCVVPSKLIVLWSQSGALPQNFIHDCFSNGKFVESVPNSCTNPGTSTGSATHSHSTAGASHGHTACSVAHTHPTGVNSVSWDVLSNGGSGSGRATGSHGHSSTSGSATPAATITNTTSPADHGADCSDPVHITTKYIKYTPTAISLRSNQLPLNSVVMWADTAANRPSNFDHLTAYNTKFLKGVTNACTAPGSCGGVATHSHSSAGASKHAYSLASHAHSFGTLSNYCPGQQHGAGSAISGKHSHGAGSLAVTTSTGVGCTDVDGTHTHDTESINPPFTDLAFIKKSSVSMRTPGIPKNAITVWNCTLASIPLGFALTDGTGSSTINLLGKHIRGVATDCTAPGCTGGSATHSHSGGAHIHTVNTGHTHAATGTSATDPGGSNSIGSSSARRSLHTHTASTPTGAGGSGWSTSSAGTHCHGTANNLPATIEAAFIQKV